MYRLRPDAPGAREALDAPCQRTYCSQYKTHRQCEFGCSSPQHRASGRRSPWHLLTGRSMHQEKKCASRRTGCVLTHQTLGTLWTHPGSTHTAPNAKRTGNVNSDAARHGTMLPDAARHGICLPDGAWQRIFVLDARCQGIFLLDAQCQGIFLLDTAVSGHFPSGHSCVRAFSFWMQLCQGK